MTVDLRPWAREKAPTLTTAEWLGAEAMARETGEGAYNQSENLKRQDDPPKRIWGPERSRALLAHLREIAEVSREWTQSQRIEGGLVAVHERLMGGHVAESYVDTPFGEAVARYLERQR